MVVKIVVKSSAKTLKAGVSQMRVSKQRLTTNLHDQDHANGLDSRGHVNVTGRDKPEQMQRSGWNSLATSKKSAATVSGPSCSLFQASMSQGRLPLN